MIDGLVATGQHLLAEGYRFTAITPATHARVIARSPIARDLTDIFGWSRVFDRPLLDPDIFDALAAAGLLERRGTGWVSRARFASLGDSLYAHSAYPTLDSDAVFFGPDTYRFVSALRRTVPRCGLLVDIGCGAGAGGLELRHRADQVLLTDINRRALAFAEANALLAGAKEASMRWSDVLDQVDEQPDVIIANPPYLADPLGRAYRDGGGDFGTALSQRILREGLRRLAPGGRLLLYTGAPVMAGVDQFLIRVKPLLRHAHAEVVYEELDPDVFGEELERPAYADIERIAVVILSITKREQRGSY